MSDLTLYINKLGNFEKKQEGFPSLLCFCRN